MAKRPNSDAPYSAKQLQRFAALWDTETKRHIEPENEGNARRLVSANVGSSSAGVLARLSFDDGSVEDVNLNPVAAARLAQMLITAGQNGGWVVRADFDCAFKASDV